MAVVAVWTKRTPGTLSAELERPPVSTTLIESILRALTTCSGTQSMAIAIKNLEIELGMNKDLRFIGSFLLAFQHVPILK